MLIADAYFDLQGCSLLVFLCGSVSLWRNFFLFARLEPRGRIVRPWRDPGLFRRSDSLPGCTTTAKADPANRYTLQYQLEECRREKPAQLIETMAKFSQQEASDSEPPSQSKRYLSVLAEAWVLFTIVAFFVVRVLGSNVFKHFLRSVRH